MTACICFLKAIQVKRFSGGQKMKNAAIKILCLTLCLMLTGCANAEGTVQDSESVQDELSAEGNEQENETVGQESTEVVEASVSQEQERGSEEQVEEIPFSSDFYEYESMADLLGEYGIRFGTCMNATTSQDYTLQGLVGQHFNSITATNDMKAYCLLDQNASMKAADGMPVMDYSGSLPIIEAAMNNGAQVRGHVLVWDANMSSWFFKEGYKSNGAYVDRATMLKRLESYITQVINYYEENYPGVIYCWDVVNEAVGDSASDYEGDDARHVRKVRGGAENLFYTVIGDDYVELSFLYARNAIEALQQKNPELDIKLFYNDYSTFQDNKCNAICELVKSINSFAKDSDGNYRKLADGVGMQGYIGGYGTQSGCMSAGDIPKIKKAINKYAELGVEVQITEMSVRNYKNDVLTVNNHKRFYRMLMEALVEINSGEEKPLTAICIWGLTDMATIDKNSYSYKMNGCYNGLFTPGYEVKEAFHEVYVMLKEKQAEKQAQ